MPVLDDTTLPIARTLSTTREALLAGRPFRSRDLEAPGPAGPITVSVFTHEEADEPAPGIYWIHGGGMTAGSRFGATEALDTAAAVKGVVISVEYRLAPEHPAPAPLEDCYAGWLWVVANAEDLGIDRHRIVLAGGSAGGGLAAALALRLRDEDGPRGTGLMLSCPMLDDRMTSTSSGQMGDDLIWNRGSNEYGWRALLGERAGTDGVLVYEAPGRATDLGGLPPTFVGVGSADLFRDEDVAFASRIWAAGGDAELHVWPGGFHGFEDFAPNAPLSLDSARARQQWLRRVLGPLQI